MPTIQGLPLEDRSGGCMDRLKTTVENSQDQIHVCKSAQFMHVLQSQLKKDAPNATKS